MSMAADPKRQSFAGKVATPKPSAQSGPSAELVEALRKAVGSSVAISTVAGSTLEGPLFTICPVTNLVAINTEPGQNNVGSFHVVHTSQVEKLRYVSTPNGSTGFASAVPAIARLDMRALQNRADAAVRKQKEYDATRGKGVTKDGQDIFDALARTLPARWHEKSIVVSDAVLIKAPYRAEDCSAPQNQQKALQRVKQVLENERAKIAQRAKGTAAAQGPRKGG